MRDTSLFLYLRYLVSHLAFFSWRKYARPSISSPILLITGRGKKNRLNAKENTGIRSCVENNRQSEKRKCSCCQWQHLEQPDSGIDCVVDSKRAQKIVANMENGSIATPNGEWIDWIFIRRL
ncbi:hypothetical protein AVEN_197209-1 [Araneus ventricosus]|uniref:Uncharacterized protein n=1 Tax=Araneus ventricosus TaxID=182803 RepID=A0A4Y2GH26_ARAVE|nr:hypothetical protein AVEN_197209-1 [Araneus ventricosus]